MEIIIMNGFTKERFLQMCDAAEKVESLVRDWMNIKTINNSHSNFQIVDKEEQKAGIANQWHIPDLRRESDGLMVEVKEDFSSAWTGNIAIEKNCLDRMIAYVEANNLKYPLLCSVNHKEYSILFFKTEGLQDKLAQFAREGKCRLLQGGDRNEWNYIINLEFAKSFCDFYDGLDFPTVAKQELKGRRNPPK